MIPIVPSSIPVITSIPSSPIVVSTTPSSTPLVPSIGVPSVPASIPLVPSIGVPTPSSSLEPRNVESLVAPQDGVLSVSVDSQTGRYILIPSFEVLDSEDVDRSRARPWGKSCIWYSTVEPVIREEYLLLEKAIESMDSENDSLLSNTMQKLQSLNSEKYSDTTRVSREFLVGELETLDALVRSHDIPCAQIIRRDTNRTKTNSVTDTKAIAVITSKFTSEDTFRVQMNNVKGTGGTLFVDLQFDDEGEYAGCAFLNLADKNKAIKFGENYVSEGIDKTAFKTMLSGLDRFMVNGADRLPDILAGLDGHKQAKGHDAESREAATTEHESNVELDPKKSKKSDKASTKVDFGRY
ncbi:MAG: hypothetical protein PHY80_06395 [Rickettsiales bacterium]|nr:hypothetical protein [Rickettsiales bacterium]